MSTPLLIVFGAIICLINGSLAARKGYNFYLWVLAGGIIGLVILSFLPFVNRGDLSGIEQRERTKTGNIIGGVFTALALIQIVPALLALLISVANPKMSGAIINGRELTQAEWDACGRDSLKCLQQEMVRPHR